LNPSALSAQALGLTRTPLLDAFEQQALWCAMPSPFTSRLLRISQAWLAHTPDAHAALAALAPEPLAGAVALRWAAALHLLALRGLQPWAALWPPAPQAGDVALQEAIGLAWRTQQPVLQDALSRPPQTNEVQRSLALLPGLMWASAATGLPLRLLELGASAGLNLWCDRYRYESAAWSWGDADAALCLQGDWRGPAPWLGAAPALRIHDREGCDANPIDLARPGQAQRLTSFIWPDQPDRLLRVSAAATVATACFAAQGRSLQAQAGAAFLAERLASTAPGVATVVMHSVVWQYLTPAEQHGITAAIEAAGARATPDAPLAWLRFEPPAADLRVELRCRLWPAGPGLDNGDGCDCPGDTLLALCHPHGAWVDWVHSEYLAVEPAPP